MDTPIERAEHKEFERRIDVEMKRLADKDNRQNQRIDLLEKNVEKMGALTSSVERLAVSMENMLKEQERQGKRLDALEVRDEVSALTVAMERMNAVMENALETQKQQGKRLEALESRDGEMWRKAIGYIATAILGVIVGFVFRQLGM